MTNTANDNDPRVTQAYRDLATEKTPPALDDRVLALAAAAARTRYGLARAWARPVAWAATIGLCLAIVVEVAEFRGEPPVPAALEIDSVAGEFAAEDRANLREAEEKALIRAGEARNAAVPASAAALAAKRESAPTCDEAQRASPESWYKCAEALREMGLEDEADFELEALRNAFPDFPVTGSRVSN